VTLATLARRLFWAAVYLIDFLKELAVANYQVTKIVLAPRLSIRPGFLAIPLDAKTDFEITSFANSITLTPGTITVKVSGNDLTVHALVREGAIDLEGGAMNRRVTRFERAR
jgi:multicomponent Na+:H+ antiporter subunit E